MQTRLSAGQQLLRVRSFSNDESVIYVEFRNGLTGTADNDGSLDLNVGDVLLYDQTQSRITKVPHDLWPTSTSVGVVRLVSDERTVVDNGGRLVLLPPSTDVVCAVGNTVEYEDNDGVLGVLSETSVSALDSIGEIGPSAIDRYRVEPDTESRASFADFGGLSDVVARAKELIELPLSHHEELKEINARPVKGVLFTGEPGTGKTMLARIIADVCKATFYEISGPEVINKWVGQSEQIIRMIFDDAATKKRAIVFFDELDSIATRRDTDSNEHSRRVVAQLLTALDGFRQEQNVIVIGTTNRPQDIDVALRRPGRLDWQIHFGLPSLQDREAILEVSSRKLKTEGALSHRRMAEITDGWSGAELTAMWTEAALLAVKSGRSAIHEEDYWGAFERVRDKRALLNTTIGE
ncbi:MAG: protease regulatory subunit [Frondihabitans sp.]|nr:protease regulatory subunit [Frondihabitans sp.]